MSTPTANATLSVAAILAESARRHATRPAITFGGASTSYEELWDQTRAYAGALRDAGIGEGDRIAVLIPNVTDFARVYYAILSLGAVVVPIHALLKRHEIQYMLTDAQVKLMVCAAPLLGEGAPGAQSAGAEVLTVMAPEAGDLPRLEDLAAAATPIDTYLPRNPLDIATILYTSGTTGKPKGALGTHLALVEQVNVILLNTLDIRAGDKIFGGLPLFHTFGQTVVLNAGLRAGAELLLLPKFTGEAALSMVLDEGVHIFAGVPTMYLGLLEAVKSRPETAPELRYAVSGGASLPMVVLEAFNARFGALIHEGYGLTETSPVASFNHVGKEPRPGTIGQPIWGVEVEIARAEFHDTVELLPRGELGELVVRGHNLFSGYLNRPEATAEAMVDGWFRTGDLGTKDADDYLTIVDRKKDMILRNGYNVYPREVEEVLVAHPEITNAAVFGVPDEKHGQEIVAAVTLLAGSLLDATAIGDYARERLAAYKYPRLVEIVAEFPLGPSGKVLKRELVTRYGKE
ncbi:long-chain fatty acid--CoA ligase [Paeniglutamicibacter sp. MACA_103]|uniref:long-chain-fatty-acid--CoA ligase n=1 Tax=Paeniglutamicibacter sp. MACA_103 TaxID=3377337 RepID=UPI0038961196